MTWFRFRFLSKLHHFSHGALLYTEPPGNVFPLSSSQIQFPMVSGRLCSIIPTTSPEAADLCFHVFYYHSNVSPLPSCVIHKRNEKSVRIRGFSIESNQPTLPTGVFSVPFVLLAAQTTHTHYVKFISLEGQ